MRKQIRKHRAGIVRRRVIAVIAGCALVTGICAAALAEGRTGGAQGFMNGGSMPPQSSPAQSFGQPFGTPSQMPGMNGDGQQTPPQIPYQNGEGEQTPPEQPDQNGDGQQTPPQIPDQNGDGQQIPPQIPDQNGDGQQTPPEQPDQNGDGQQTLPEQPDQNGDSQQTPPEQPDQNGEGRQKPSQTPGMSGDHQKPLRMSGGRPSCPGADGETDSGLARRPAARGAMGYVSGSSAGVSFDDLLKDGVIDQETYDAILAYMGQRADTAE